MFLFGRSNMKFFLPSMDVPARVKPPIPAPLKDHEHWDHRKTMKTIGTDHIATLSFVPELIAAGNANHQNVQEVGYAGTVTVTRCLEKRGRISKAKAILNKFRWLQKTRLHRTACSRSRNIQPRIHDMRDLAKEMATDWLVSDMPRLNQISHDFVAFIQLHRRVGSRASARNIHIVVN